MSGPFGAGALQLYGSADSFYPYTIDQSLRFVDGDNAYLTRTNSSAGNRRTWTFSCWVKRGDLNASQNYILGATTDNYNVNWAVFFFGSDELTFYSYTSTQNYQLHTTEVFRDPSAWYHLVLAWDTTQSTADDRIILYVNGSRVTDLDTYAAPSLNYEEAYINNNIQQDLGRAATAANGYDGYMAEVNFIDGQALAPTSFGETKAGIWIPKEYSGSYGTNGYHLTFKEAGDLGADSSYTTHDIFGDSSAVATYIFDGSIVDAGGNYSGTTTSVTFTDGIVGTQAGVFNGTSSKWEANTHLLGANATAQSFSLSGWFQVSANYKYMITDGYAGTGGGYFAIHTNGSGGLTAGTGDASGSDNIAINSSQTVTDGKWHHFAYTSSVSSRTATGKLWVDGNYEGSDTTTSTIAYSNETAFGWFAYSNIYHACSLDQIRIFNRAITEAEVMQLAGQFGSDESGANNDFNHANISPTDVVLDSPTNNFATMNPLDGNGPDMQEGNLKPFGDTTFAVFEGFKGTFPMSSGKWYWEVNAADVNNIMQIGITSTEATGVGSSTNLSYHTDAMVYNNVASKAIGTGGFGTGASTKTTTSYGATYTDGDIIGVALDLDSATTTLTFYKNNSSQGTAFSSLASDEYVALYTGLENSFGIFNFGQDSSFAGTKTAQGNTDGNGQGDFYYTPPSGFLACCTANLPDPGIDPAKNEEPADYFSTVLWSGNGTSGVDNQQSITGVGFQPDFAWIKSRNNASGHALYDVQRGTTGHQYYLSSDDSISEDSTYKMMTTFDSDGYTLSTLGGSHTNRSGWTYVGWNWLAGGSAVSNNNGTIASSVSANTEAGFSIVGYTGTGSAGTVGHGLSSAPEMIIQKMRNPSSAENWTVFHKDLTSANYALRLNLTNTEFDGSGNYFSATSSTTFSIGSTSQVNENTKNSIAYCFHSVDGYSKVGSYTGNGSTDGAFVYTGFKPAWIMVKTNSTSNRWVIFDNTRSPVNPVEEKHELNPDDNSAEGTSGTDCFDFLSNGFKLRRTGDVFNTSGHVYIYLAFAEQPFKYANAR